MGTLSILVVALLSAGSASRSPLPPETATRNPCIPFGGVSGNHKWILGDHKVMPVSAQHQGQVMQRLKRGAVEEVSASVAKAMTGNAALPRAAHYYLARVGYIGGVAPGTIPSGVSMSADVDTGGVAYVSSFVLSHSRRTSEAVVMLASATPIQRVVSTCGAAQ